VTLGTDTIVDEEGLADEMGDNKGCMLMLEEFKTDGVLKIGVTLGKLHTGISIIDAVGKTGVVKIREVKTGGVLTDSVMEHSVKELVLNSVSEVTGTSTVETWS
jgi:hypothetical protein